MDKGREREGEGWTREGKEMGWGRGWTKKGREREKGTVVQYLT